MSVTESPLQRSAYDPVAWNFKLIAQHTLDGFGGMGEGMSIQIAPDGRRIIWLAHESAPKNFTAVDVSDPRKPKVICQTDLPQGYMRSNSLEITDQVMAVAYQCQKVNQKPAGFELFDISKPESPKSIAFIDCSGPHSRGVHQLWFTDGEYVHMASGAPDFEPNHPLDDQCYRCFDVRNPSKPTEIGRWWLPGTRKGDNEPPPARHAKPALDKGNRAHNTNVYPQRPDRMYLAYLDAGMFIMDISDKSKPKPISRFDNSPPYTGFTHTVVPLFERGLVIMTDEFYVGQCRRLAEADLDPRRARREQSGSDLDLSDAESGGLQDPWRPLRRAQHSREHAAPDIVAIGPDHPRHLLQRRASRLRHLQRLSAEGSRHLRPAGTGAVEVLLDSAQRRVRGRAQDRLHRRPLLRWAVHPGDGFLTLMGRGRA